MPFGTSPELLVDKKGLIPALQQLFVSYFRTYRPTWDLSVHLCVMKISNSQNSGVNGVLRSLDVSGGGC